MKFHIKDKLGDWNPQFVRELQGRLKTRNLSFAVGISLVGQFLIYLSFLSSLPKHGRQTDRYCIGSVPADWQGFHHSSTGNNFCVEDSLGNLVVNHQLWALDIFVTLSVIGMFVLLVAGTYMLISDVAKEEQNHTLDFIRLSPQSSTTILLGKMMGVPVLLYLTVALGIPWHLIAGVKAGIPLTLIAGFYALMAASCLFFYSLALLYSLVGTKFGTFQAWLGTGAVLLFLVLLNSLIFSGSIVTYTTLDWFTLFLPVSFLPHLVAASHVVDRAVYLDLGKLATLTWYDLNLWQSAITSFGFSLLTYGLGSFWFWQALKRRFHNPDSTLIAKRQSYWLSGGFVALALGFAAQQREWGTYEQALFENFAILQVLTLILFLCLIVALTPHRQTLQDWARYRHFAGKENRSLWRDLAWGDRSPANIAIALNLITVTAVTLPGILLLPFKEYRTPIFFSWLLMAGLIFFLASLYQSMLYMRTQKRAIWAAIAVLCFTGIPLASLGVFNVSPTESHLWLLSVAPFAATEYAAPTTVGFIFLGQVLASSVFFLKTTQQLKQAGESETKRLLTATH